MKTTKTLLAICLLSLMMSLGCKKFGLENLPFKATFQTTLVSLDPTSPDCSAPHVALNTQAGGGTATHIGSFTTTITFCVDPATFEYVNGEGSLIAANGDEIFIAIALGQILPTTEPGYDLEFKDPFMITGGTGRFYGASGGGTTDSFVNLTTQQTDHVWTGTISVPK